MQRKLEKVRTPNARPPATMLDEPCECTAKVENRFSQDSGLQNGHPKTCNFMVCAWAPK